MEETMRMVSKHQPVYVNSEMMERILPYESTVPWRGWYYRADEKPFDILTMFHHGSEGQCLADPVVGPFTSRIAATLDGGIEIGEAGHSLYVGSMDGDLTINMTKPNPTSGDIDTVFGAVIPDGRRTIR
jgi:hypothetical protein